MSPVQHARLALAVLLLLMIGACQATPADDVATSYFPLRVGERWIYDSTFLGPQTRKATTVTAVCRFRDDQGDRYYLVSTCVDEELVQAELLVHRGAEIGQPILFNREGEPRPRDPPDVIARVDLAVGQSWRWEGEIANVQHRSVYRAANRGRVLTPAGEFEGIRVLMIDETPDAPAASVERWYVRGVGLVKEAGATLIPVEGGRFGMVELVRVLREHGIVPVDEIGCCSRSPGE